MIKTISNFLKNIGFNMLADLSVRASKSLLIILISNLLGVSEMGSYSIALTYLGFGILFSNWGFGNLLTREVARARESYNEYLTNFAVIRILFAGLAILLIHIIVPRLPYSNETISVVKIISLSLLATTIIKLVSALFIAFEELKYVSIISFVSSTLKLLLSGTLILLGGNVVQVAIIYTILEYLTVIFSIVITIKYLGDYRPLVNLKFAFSQIAKAFPFFWIGILVMLDTRAEIIILSLYFNESMVGYYTAVNTILGGVTLFSEGIRNAVFPIVARYQQTSKEKLETLVALLGKYLLLITLPLSILLFFLSDEIVSLFFGKDYTLSILMLEITIWSFISYTLTVVLSNLLMAHDQEKKVAGALFVSGIISVILNLILPPLIGVTSVAITRLFTSFLMFFLCLYFHIKTTGYSLFSITTLLWALLSGLLMFAAIFFLQRFNPVLGLTTGSLIYLGSLFLTRLIQPADISIWKEVFRDLFA